MLSCSVRWVCAATEVILVKTRTRERCCVKYTHIMTAWLRFQGCGYANAHALMRNGNPRVVAWLPSCSAEHGAERQVAKHSQLCIPSVIVSRSPSIPELLPVADLSYCCFAVWAMYTAARCPGAFWPWSLFSPRSELWVKDAKSVSGVGRGALIRPSSLLSFS